MTATLMPNAATVVANHACFRHQPSLLSSRRLEGSPAQMPFSRGLTFIRIVFCLASRGSRTEGWLGPVLHVPPHNPCNAGPLR
jgi:hypothetical protein